MMLKLKLQYFGHLMRRVDSLEKTLMPGGIRGRRRRGRPRRETTLEELHPRCLIYMSPALDDKNLELEPEVEAKIE